MICSNCGSAASGAAAKFCVDCGCRFADAGNSNKLQPDLAVTAEFDSAESIKKYLMSIEEVYFDRNSDFAVVRSLSARLCAKFQISQHCQKRLLHELDTKKNEINAFFSIEIEFDENVIDSFAGHDTYLRFRITNSSMDEYFKVRLLWDDPEARGNEKLSVLVPDIVKPGQSVISGGTYIFRRAGPKELRDLQLIVENQYFESVDFLVSPFSFRVGSIDKNVYQSISTTNTISVEGRGVIDASGMGVSPSAHGQGIEAPRWVKLSCKYSLAKFVDVLVNRIVGAEDIERRNASNAITNNVAASHVHSRVDEASSSRDNSPHHLALSHEQSEAQAVVADLSISKKELNLRGRVDLVFFELSKLVRELDDNTQTKMVSPGSLSLSSLDRLSTKIGDNKIDETIWIFFEDVSTAKAAVESESTMQDALSIVTYSGITIRRRAGDVMERYSWGELSRNQIGFFSQTVGSQTVALTLGMQGEKSYLPGIRFDLRGYKGSEPIDRIIKQVERTWFAVLASPEVLVSELRELGYGLGVFLIDDAPPKTLRTALYSVGSEASKADLLLLIDSSRLYNGADGLLVTRDRIFFWSNKSGQSKSIRFSDIKSVEVGANGTDGRLLVNGSRFFQSDRISISALKSLAETLGRFVGHLRGAGEA